jgi:hypothetical protein
VHGVHGPGREVSSTADMSIFPNSMTSMLAVGEKDRKYEACRVVDYVKGKLFKFLCSCGGNTSYTYNFYRALTRLLCIAKVRISP